MNWEEKGMKKPTLVIMAAGMGSRYGGLKQIDPIDRQGHVIMDFSIFDAVRAGFEKVVLIIKRENADEFKSFIGNRIEKQIKTEYVFQDLNNLPVGFTVPKGREKPWGTGHAVLSCLNVIDGPFAVINADDYYGRQAFQKIFDFLTSHDDFGKYQYAMVGYLLKNTLTENGHVARGVCQIDSLGRLSGIMEHTHIEKRENGPAYTEDDGKTWVNLPENTVVSMNMWGFTYSILPELKAGFSDFLEKNLPVNPLKCEYFLPYVVDDLIHREKAEVAVLESHDRWYGVTYKEDKPVVVKAMQKLKEEGIYPQNLWG